MSRNRAMTGVEFQKFLRQPINSFILINIDSIRINKNYKRVEKKISIREDKPLKLMITSVSNSMSHHRKIYTHKYSSNQFDILKKNCTILSKTTKKCATSFLLINSNSIIINNSSHSKSTFMFSHLQFLLFLPIFKIYSNSNPFTFFNFTSKNNYLIFTLTFKYIRI